MHFLPVTVEEVIQQDESKGCTGYDKDENALMVPMEGNNKITVKILGAPPALLQEVTFAAATEGKLTIAPEVPTAEEQELTLSGTADALGVKVQLEIDGTKVDLFEADVLKKLTKTLEIHAITEENDDIQKVVVGVNAGANKVCVEAGANEFRDTKPQGDDKVVGNNITTGADGVCNTTANNQNLVPANITTAAALQNYLNKKIWGNQANAHFTITRKDHVVNYDLDLDGDTGDAGGVPPGPAEENEISDAAKNAAVDYNFYYVNNVQGAIGYAIIARGELWTGANGNNSIVNHTAHETGHVLGIGYESNDNKDVMFKTGINVNPCRVTRRNWRAIIR